MNELTDVLGWKGLQMHKSLEAHVKKSQCFNVKFVGTETTLENCSISVLSLTL